MSQHVNNLYYLFPGAAGARRKRMKMHLAVGAIVGLMTAGALAGVIYAMQR